MNFKQRAIVGFVVVAVLFYFNINQKNSKKDLTNYDIESIMIEANKSFASAEAKVLGKPPVPDDTPSGPDPDPEKCVCKGTGKIIQGDGHVTPCPYHSAKNNDEACDCGCNKKGCSCQCKNKEVTRSRGLLFPIFR
jgi:hypothetical protein